MNCPWNFPGQNTGVGSYSLLQGIFPTQGSNAGLLDFWQILYQLSHQGYPLCCYCMFINGITFGQRESQNGIMVLLAECQARALSTIPDCYCVAKSLRDRSVVLKNHRPASFLTWHFNTLCTLSCLIMSYSLWPHGLQPISLLCPWNFPGKNNGVGCRFLLQGICST